MSDGEDGMGGRREYWIRNAKIVLFEALDTKSMIHAEKAKLYSNI